MSESIGPQIPSHLLPAVSATADDDADEDDYMPALPPDLAPARARTGPSTEELTSGSRSPSNDPAPSTGAARRVLGPVLPTADFSDADSDSDAEVGPQPPPARFPVAKEKSAVEEFIEREERRRKNVEEAKKPKKLEERSGCSSHPRAGIYWHLLWTETPAERQQRIADEVSGRKRKAVNAEPEVDLEDAKRKRKRDEEIRRGVQEHSRRVRGAALVDTHMEREAQKKGDDNEEPAAIWDHSRDMSVGGRLMDEKQRKQMLREARALGDRFGTGKSGGFL
ncbi:hypothetical protein EDC04DRAFT_2871970 [Pisolithus marmoratus]|nr:hypothetical protein EDC04DRAFT_2871970 [Pisolithus marmoratus]